MSEATPTHDGTARPICVYGDPVLRQRCAEVEDFGTELRRLVDDMFASMYAADGVGLAANQIGVPLRLFVYDCTTDDGRFVGVVVNPRLVLPAPGERELVEESEGCLSIPGPHAVLARTSTAVVHGQDPDGVPITVEGEGYLARCLQHECDHLDGQLYIDRLPARVRREVLRAAELEQRPRG